MKIIKISLIAFIINLMISQFSTATQLEDSQVENIELQIQKFALDISKKHQFDEKEVINQLKNLNVRQDIIKKISKPAESMPWYRYRKIFIQNKRILEGVEFFKKHYETLKKAKSVYGVSPEIIVAIIGVETFYGRIQGDYPVIEALYTLGFHYPKREKFFRQELVEFFLLTREQNWPLESIKGSYAGAMGMGQFISSSYRHYAVDFNQDGKINLFSDPVDMIGSVANYFKQHHWKKDGFIGKIIELNRPQKSLIQDKLKLKHTLDKIKSLDIDISDIKDKSNLAGIFSFEMPNEKSENWLVGDNFYVITRYNHSKLYALAVLQLSQLIQKQMELNSQK